MKKRPTTNIKCMLEKELQKNPRKRKLRHKKSRMRYWKNKGKSDRKKKPRKKL
jgi:hypothetical protein